MVETLTTLLIFIIVIKGSHQRKKYRAAVVRYPKDTNFWATDFFVKGCRNFIEKCPSMYKVQPICARSYNGDYRNFPNYCEMQYENCNTWRSKPCRSYVTSFGAVGKNYQSEFLQFACTPTPKFPETGEFSNESGAE